MTRQVLVIDDDPVQRRLLEAHITRMGHLPLLRDSAAGGLEALQRDTAGTIAAVVLDLIMPDGGGLDMLADMRRRGLHLPVVVITARSGIEVVVEAMRAGAFDFVVKPASPEKLQQTIDKAIRVQDARRRSAQQPSGPAAAALTASVGAAMRPVMALAARAAGSNIPLLIEGETGVGKEWLAEAIRAAGPRANAAFVVVNCGALPAALAESVLFGHEKGAFTDAAERHAGKFVDADGGTLFLDEIGELTPEVQVKLLRVLQSGAVDAVGGRRPVQTDVRIIAATHRDLAAEVAAGRFREDLFYRLNVLPIHLPPLRERRDEIAGLATGFLRRFQRQEALSPAREITPEALALLARYDWPGNIRQLENAVHRAVVLAGGARLGPDDFPQIAALIPLSASKGAGAPSMPNGPGTRPEPPAAEWLAPATDVGSAQALSAFSEDGQLRTLEAVEADLIRMAMTHYQSRISEIARRLGIGRSTLYRKMRLYGISEAGALSDKDRSEQSLRGPDGG